LGEALGWAHEQGLSVENELSYLHEFDHITLARVLLARYQSDHADGSVSGVMGLLERLLKAAEEGGRQGSTIEILVLQALAYHAQGDLPAALNPLQKALTLAEPPTALPEGHRDGEPLTEPLSQRELEVLRMFKTDLSGPEIARELVIALSTVRTHTKSIYGKLNVNNRRAAVKRAAELNLI
jgi:LuxR family maltose regulon positive regulatory protein